jgi:hypothetical protein
MVQHFDCDSESCSEPRTLSSAGSSQRPSSDRPCAHPLPVAAEEADGVSDSTGSDNSDSSISSDSGSEDEDASSDGDDDSAGAGSDSDAGHGTSRGRGCAVGGAASHPSSAHATSTASDDGAPEAVATAALSSTGLQMDPEAVQRVVLYVPACALCAVAG